MHTPQDAQRQKMLEEKLKTHIQREFNLGEKVIALLKQKTELESSLREHQDAQGKLEKELELMVQSKEDVEEKFLLAQTELQERRNKLRTRTRIIVEDEEQSRTTLKQLQQKIRALQTRLNAADVQKIEEKKHLVLHLQKLRKKEALQRQKLREISQQRDSTEKRLRAVVKKYKQLASIHHHEKKQHEELLESLYKEQINREARIELLRDEKQINEEDLLKEVQSLKHAKTELEDKLKHLEQQAPSSSWELDADLLQVIEKQNQHIQELQDNAHKRSTMLRAENETLRQEMEEMLNSQEKAKWENRMLETSLKDLQKNLAEYIQLKNKFEEVQEEKERFEQLFQRRLQFIEQHTAEQQPAQEMLVDADVHDLQEKQESPEEPLWKTPPQKPRQEPQKSSPSFLKRWFSRNSRVMEWLHMTKPKIMAAFLVIVVVALSTEIYRQIPWRSMRSLAVSEPKKAVVLNNRPEKFSKIERVKHPEAFMPEKQKASTRRPHAASKAPEKQSTTKVTAVRTPVAKSPPRVQHPPKISVVKKKRQPKPPEKTPPKRLTPSKRPKLSDTIVVRLQTDRAKRFLSQEPTPFPTVENNSILRRHQQR